MNTGELHEFFVRQLITPDPYSPPTMNAAFLRSAMTTTHSARDHSSSGIPLSVDARNSERIAPESWRRLTSSFEGAANTVDATSSTPNADSMCLTIGNL